MTCQSCQFDHPDTRACACGATLCPDCRKSHTCPPPEVPTLWAHQARALEQLEQAMAAGETAICVTAPTGGGKTRLIKEIAAQAREHYRKVAIYTNRKLLTTQSSGVLDTHGVTHGIMAAGHEPALLRDVQIASIQTIESRVYQRQSWQLHQADIVIVDEVHGNMNPTALKIVTDHQAQGAVIIGFTATPVGLGGTYKRLIVAGTNSELRACGALVPCHTIGVDEPDLKHVSRNKTGEYTQGGVVKAIMTHKIFGRVYGSWCKLNPAATPTILFAPGVKESRWFVEEFEKEGVTAAHIDAETPDSERQDIIEGSREGRVCVVCNRFVLREGIDMPWLQHCVMATAFGALSNFLQAGGRLLRAYPGVDHVTLQCHGGSWWAHGDLNDDRQWELRDTDRALAKAQKERREKGEESEPIRCPNCGGIRSSGPKCPFCGHQHKRSVRMVVQVDGELKRMVGNVTKKKKQVSDEQRQWDGYYYRAKNSRNGMTFNQARGMYRREYRCDPPDTLKNVPPPGHVDWDRRVREVSWADMAKWKYEVPA